MNKIYYLKKILIILFILFCITFVYFKYSIEKNKSKQIYHKLKKIVVNDNYYEFKNNSINKTKKLKFKHTKLIDKNQIIKDKFSSNGKKYKILVNKYDLNYFYYIYTFYIIKIEIYNGKKSINENFLIYNNQKKYKMINNGSKSINISINNKCVEINNKIFLTINFNKLFIGKSEWN